MYNLYPQYPTYPHPQQQQYSDLLARLQNLENKGYGQTQQQYQNVAQTVSPVNQSTVTTQPNDNKTYSVVSSESQAWEQVVDMSGAKQVFFNETNNEFYVKQFDANIPKTYKTIYKPVESVPDTAVSEVVEDNKSATEGVLTAINDVSDNISALTGKIDSLITYIQDNPFVYMKDIAKQNEPKSKGGKK